MIHIVGMIFDTQSTSIFNSDRISKNIKKKKKKHQSCRRKDIFDKITFLEVCERKLKLSEEHNGNSVGLLENMCNTNTPKGRKLQHDISFQKIFIKKHAGRGNLQYTKISRSQMLPKTGTLKYFAIFTGKQLRWSHYF